MLLLGSDVIAGAVLGGFIAICFAHFIGKGYLRQNKEEVDFDEIEITWFVLIFIKFYLSLRLLKNVHFKKNNLKEIERKLIIQVSYCFQS